MKDYAVAIDRELESLQGIEQQRVDLKRKLNLIKEKLINLKSKFEYMVAKTAQELKGSEKLQIEPLRDMIRTKNLEEEPDDITREMKRTERDEKSLLEELELLSIQETTIRYNLRKYFLEYEDKIADKRLVKVAGC